MWWCCDTTDLPLAHLDTFRWRWFNKQDCSKLNRYWFIWSLSEQTPPSSSGRIIAKIALPWWCWSWCRWCIGKKKRCGQCGGLWKDLLTFFLAGHLLIRISWTYFASILWLNSLLIDLWREVLLDPQFLACFTKMQNWIRLWSARVENNEPCWTHDAEHRMSFAWCYLRSSCWLVVMAALRRVLMRTALPLAEAFLDCRAVVTVVRLSVILSLICACIRIVRRYGAMHEMRVTSCSRNDAFAAAGGKACCPKPVGCANLWDNAASLYWFHTFSSILLLTWFYLSLLDSTCLILFDWLHVENLVKEGCIARDALDALHCNSAGQPQVASSLLTSAGLRIAKMILPMKPGDKFYQPQNLLCQCGPLLSMSIVFSSWTRQEADISKLGLQESATHHVCWRQCFGSAGTYYVDALFLAGTNTKPELHAFASDLLSCFEDALRIPTCRTFQTCKWNKDHREPHRIQPGTFLSWHILQFTMKVEFCTRLIRGSANRGWITSAFL